MSQIWELCLLNCLFLKIVGFYSKNITQRKPTKNFFFFLNYTIHPVKFSPDANLRSSQERWAYIWHQAERMGHPMRLKLTLACLLVKFANHNATGDALMSDERSGRITRESWGKLYCQNAYMISMIIIHSKWLKKFYSTHW